ncbi:YkgJ family cysteine cluster protein [Halovivax gelatinilyticus]|uniref:YkgJ family cysteine cluster protein n=1 Tax=Halovivax gelatinilyticus TaxID=2961597 RepID=UPI0020CA5F1F|nr:YkgJ family cysteine cluster protein [Halovivax gelatinilyticus]
MDSLETELARARDLDPSVLAGAIESIGFECTHCGACCRSESDSDCSPSNTDTPDGGTSHTATVFPDEVRSLVGNTDGQTDWRDVARPMPFGLEKSPDGTTVGETFEWALQTTACGDCVFYDDGSEAGGCRVHADRPLICRTYPFSLALGGTSQPMGTAVDGEGLVRAHECEGLGREIDRDDALSLARALKARAIRELEEAIALVERYEPIESTDRIVVHDAEGPKRPDGSSISE